MANTLFDLAQEYLNQGLPDISGIFPPPPKTIGPVLPFLPEAEKPTGIETLFQAGRGPNDEFRGGGGDFGDLDLSDKKTVVRNVYTKLAPGRFEFVPTEIDAFRNMRSGLYQTEEGKNVDAMFTDTPTGIFKIISNIMDPKQEAFMKYPLDKIQGTYTNLASLLKGERNPTNLITPKQERLINRINRGSQIAEDFKGAGEFTTSSLRVPTGAGGKTPGPRGQRGGTPPGGGGFGAADFGPVTGEFVL